MTSNPHDALFKAVFSQPEHARGELQAVLPPALVGALDWESLTRLPGSFVTPGLAERHTDLLFSIQVHGGGEALVYLLFEHQSTPDPLMAFRLLRYLLRIWQRWHDERGEGSPLPAIVPVVLYHGGRPWSAPRAFEELVHVPARLGAEVRPYIPSFRYLVDDLSQVTDEALRGRAMMTALAKLAAVSLKHVRSGDDPIRWLAEWVELIHDVLQAPRGLEALERVLRYIVLADERAEIEALRTFLGREVGPEAEEAMTTIGQKLIEQGELEGQRKLLLRQLRRRFGHEVDADAEQRIANAGAEEMERWADRVVSAATLAEVLAD